MLKLACIIDNPGEPPVETKYRDPALLRDLGYNAIVVYETTGLSGIDNPDALADREMRHWVSQRITHVRGVIESARAADMGVYICYDAPVLARVVVEDSAADLQCDNRTGLLCPAGKQTLRRSVAALEALLDRLPAVDGVVLRFGDTDASRLPYLVGNDIYKPNCPRCSQMGATDRIVQWLEPFHNLVVNDLDKNLIVRAWNVRPGGMHDAAEVATQVAKRLPGDPADPRFILSFKFTETDFWRYQRWNPASMNLEGRPVLYELECQREFEGKGGVPNWQAGLWRDGHPEMAHLNGSAVGLAQVAQRVNLQGLFAWVRGGGWGGPFVSSEKWIDANVFAVPRLADQPDTDIGELAREWVRRRLGLAEEAQVETIAGLLERSPQHVLGSFYIGPYARRHETAWHSNGDWIQDDLIDARAAWRIIQQLPAEDLDEILHEKEQVVEQVTADRRALRTLVDDSSRKVLEPLINSLAYTESLYATLRDLLGGLIAWRRYRETLSSEQADLCQRRLLLAQNHWNHHTQRCGSLPGCATAFRENNFWDLTQDILTSLAEAGSGTSA